MQISQTVVEMDTDDDKDLKPPLTTVTSVTGNATTPSSNGTSCNNNSAPVKVKEEIKDEPMEVEVTKTTQEKKGFVDKDKRTASSPADYSEIPMVNGILSDSDKEKEINVSIADLYNDLKQNCFK